MTIAVDDLSGSPQTISNDITNLSIAMPSGVQDVTGVNSSGMERLMLLGDLSVTMNGVFNDAANMSHVVFKTHVIFASQVGRTTTITHSGQVLADELIYPNYDLTRAQDGSLVWTVTGQLSDGGLPAWS